MAKVKSRFVLGLSSSPRKGANTDTVVREILAGAEEAGAKTRFVRLADLDIAPCRARAEPVSSAYESPGGGRRTGGGISRASVPFGRRIRPASLAGCQETRRTSRRPATE